MTVGWRFQKRSVALAQPGLPPGSARRLTKDRRGGGSSDSPLDPCTVALTGVSAALAADPFRPPAVTLLVT
jgi:hypothetical protein